MKNKDISTYWSVFVVSCLIIVLNVACGTAVASEEMSELVTATVSAGVSPHDAQVVAKSVPPTLAPTATPIPTIPPTPLPTTMPTAVIEPTRPLPIIQNPADPAFVQIAEDAGVPLVVVDESNTGVWQYPEDTFIHPVAFDVHENRAYLIDAGQVLALDLAQPMQAEVLLQGGDMVEEVTVIEPLDLHIAPDGLLVLDRAGDVYGYDWQSTTWFLDRYDRPISDTSSHYYVALDGEENGRYLLETSYNYTLLYENGEQQSLWNLPDARGIDLSTAGDVVYVLQQSMFDTEAMLTAYEATRKLESFQPNFVMDQARQVVATETSTSANSMPAIYVLDQDGKRLLTFSPDYGQLQAIIQLPQDDHISAFAVHPESGQLLFVGKNRLYFYQQPDAVANVLGDPILAEEQPHDYAFLSTISGFAPPIGWDMTTRDLQMPGAPRHYRLGVHQGADFYWARDSQIFAAAKGTVIRAMHDYVPPFPAAFYEMRNQSYELGYTSEEALDFYRGQQVWLAHENGLLSRYIHLGGIAWDLAEGDTVTQGQFLGTVGNSGSPASLESPESDAHLHFELWHGEHYVGQFLRPVETRDWLNAILHDQP